MKKNNNEKQKQTQNKQETVTHLQEIKNKQLIVSVPEYPKMLSLVEKILPMCYLNIFKIITEILIKIKKKKLWQCDNN